jgi:hypothetical protein
MRGTAIVENSPRDIAAGLSVPAIHTDMASKSKLRQADSRRLECDNSSPTITG